MTRDELDAAARRLWLLVREQVGPTPAAAQDQRRLQAALAERRTKSQEFFSSSAGQWDRLRDELFGDRFHLAALAALADADWMVGDLGCGTGQVSAALAPFVARVIAVDASAAMLQAAKKRLQRLRQRRAAARRARGAADRRRAARRGDADAGAASRARAASARWPKSRACSSPAAALVVVDMLPHDRESYRQQMGHVWLGFRRRAHAPACCARAGFERRRGSSPLPPDAAGEGPGIVRRNRDESTRPTHRDHDDTSRSKPTEERDAWQL